MSTVPYRTGITTVKLLLKKICQLLTTYREAINLVVPVDKRVYVDALLQACEDFIEHVPNPRP